MGRDLNELRADVKEKCEALIREAAAAGIRVLVTSTGRRLEEQMALYAQGREVLSVVNVLRAAVGWPPISEVDNRRCVTWTLDSKHVITKDRPKAEAFDVVVLKNGQADWAGTEKVIVYGRQVGVYEALGEIGERLGLKWGGRWKKPDRPHFEI